jgi:outer membrane receptor protein involved in Fe transport
MQDDRKPARWCANVARGALLAGTAALCWAGTAAAQAPAAQSAAAQPGTDAASPDDIVVTAQRRGERLQDVPISITSLSGASLERPTVKSVSDALQTIPSVAVTQNYAGGGSLIAIRGVAAGLGLNFGGSPIAYYLDAVPFGLIKSAIAPDANVYDLERIELLRGPQGTLYGASAENGVVRVLTADPDLDSFEAKARASVATTSGGGESYRGDAAVNIPLIADRLAFRAVVGAANDGGWIDQVNRKDVNEGRHRSYRFKLGARPVDDLDIIASAWISRSHLDAPSIGVAYNRSTATRAQPVTTNFETYSLKASYHLEGADISSATSYLDFRNRSSLDLGPFGIPGADFYTQRDGTVFSQEVYVTSNGDGNWRWSVGAAYRRAEEFGLTSYTPAIAPTTTQGITSKSIAVFGELTRLFLDGRLELTAGVRYFHDRIDQTGTVGASVAPDAQSKAEATTPRFVLTYHPSSRLTFYASYSQGFRSGFPQNATVPPGFPGLGPDRLKNYEIGAKGSTPDNLLSFDLALYHIVWSDVQQTLTTPFQGLAYPLYVNSGSASGNGIDLSVTVRPVDGFELTGNVGYNDLKSDDRVLSGGLVLFEKGARLNFSPELTLGGGASYKFDIGGSGATGLASVSANYTSSQINRLFLGSFVNLREGDGIVNGKASFAVSLNTHATLTAFVDNFTNEKGTPVYRPINVENWSSRVRPRTFGVQFDYRY